MHVGDIGKTHVRIDQQVFAAPLSGPIQKAGKCKGLIRQPSLQRSRGQFTNYRYSLQVRHLLAQMVIDERAQTVQERLGRQLQQPTRAALALVCKVCSLHRQVCRPRSGRQLQQESPVCMGGHFTLP